MLERLRTALELQRPTQSVLVIYLANDEFRSLIIETIGQFSSWVQKCNQDNMPIEILWVEIVSRSKPRIYPKRSHPEMYSDRLIRMFE